MVTFGSQAQFYYFPTDHAATLTFYHEVVGLSVLRDDAEATQLQLDTSRTLTLFKPDDTEPSARQSSRGKLFPVMEMSCDSLRLLYKRLDDVGTPHGMADRDPLLPLPLGTHLDPSRAQFWFEDPDGIQISVYATREE